MQKLINSWKDMNTSMKHDVSLIIGHLCNCKVITSNYTSKEMAEDKMYSLHLIWEITNTAKYNYYDGNDTNESKLYQDDPYWIPYQVVCNLLWSFVYLINDTSSSSGLRYYCLKKIMNDKRRNFTAQIIVLIRKQFFKYKNIRQERNKNKLTNDTCYLMKISEPCLVALGYMMQDDKYREIVIDRGFMDIAGDIVDTPNFSCRRAVLWGIGQILRGSDEEIKMIVKDSTLWNRICENALNDKYYDAAIQAFYCVSNGIIYGNNKIKEIIVCHKGLEIILRFLDLEFTGSPSDVVLSLETLDYLLYGIHDHELVQLFESLGGLRKIQSLGVQECAIEEVKAKSEYMIHRYWPSNNIVTQENDDQESAYGIVSSLNPRTVNGLFEFAIECNENGKENKNHWFF